MERVAPFMRLSLLGIIRQRTTDKLVFMGGKHLIPLFTASQPERFVHEFFIPSDFNQFPKLFLRRTPDLLRHAKDIADLSR